MCVLLHGDCALNFPLSETYLMDEIRQHCKKAPVSFCSVVMKALCFEEAVCANLKDMELVCAKDGEEAQTIKFHINFNARQRKALTKIDKGILYQLREFHPVIDAIGLFIHEGQD